MLGTAGLSWAPQQQEQHQEGGAPAPAPSVTPAGAATDGSGNPPSGAGATAAAPVYETLGEDDQIILDMRKEHDAKVLAEAPDAPAPVKKKKGAKDEKQTAPDPAPAAAASTAIVKYKTPDEAVSAIVAAIESGDAKKIAKALGKPEAFLDASDAKWMAFREQQNAVRERDKTLTKREHDFNTLVAEARTEYGPAIKAAKAYRDGDLTAFVTLVQELTGERYDDAQRKVIQGEIALDPNTRAMREEIAALKRERAAEKAAEKEAREAAEKQANQKAQYEQAVQAVQAELANHRVAKLKGFERAVLTRVRDSWDGSDYTMSFEEAADAIISERDEEAAALGYTRQAPALPAGTPAPRALPAAAPAAAPALPPRGRAADARKPDLEPWADPDAEDMDDDAIIASIQRDIKAGRLRA